MPKVDNAVTEKRIRRSFDLESMQAHALALGGQCLAKKYINSTYKLLFECKNAHKWKATPLQVMGKKNSAGAWCPKCTEDS